MNVRRGFGTTGLLMQAVVLACLAACALAPSAGAGASFMSLDEIHPGMKGKARSVFSGSTIEEFDVEILGVLRNWRPGGDLILAKASGPQVDEAGIAAGMSGTPVYVDGKLIGAMAYTWAFSKEPITGITPIAEMLGLEKSGADSGSAEPNGRSEISPGESERTGGAMVAIETPLLVSGFHPAVLSMIEREASGLNMVVAQTGGAGGTVKGDTLVPGAAIAAQLVGGDGVVAAIGTVTYTEGTKVLSFGHGLGLGTAVEIPMSTAYVHAVLPSLAGSLKLASPLRMVGTVTGESLSGVVGEMGAIPSMIPVRVVVKTEWGAERTFHFQVAKSKVLTGMLVGWSTTSSALTACGAVGEMTIRGTSEIELADKRGTVHEVKYNNTIFTADPGATISKMVAVPIDVLLNNEFETVDIRSIDWTLLLGRNENVASIEEISVSPEVVAPGDSIRVSVKVKPFRGEPFLRRFSLIVPRTCEAERARVLVCSAPDMRTWEEESTTKRLPAASLEQLISQIESSGGGNRLECVLSAQNEEAGIDGRPFPSPPSSFSSVLDSSTRSGTLTEKRIGVLGGAALDTDYALEGCRSVSLKIKQQKVGR